MKVRINYNYIFYGLLVILLFEPNVFTKFSFFNYLYIIGALVTFTYAVLKYIKNKIPVDKYLVFIIFWRIYYLFLTIINSGDILKCGYQSLIIVCVFMLMEISKRFNNNDLFPKVLINLFFTLLTINFVLYIFKPLGLYYDEGISLYFLGIRTRFTDYAYPLLVISCYMFSNKKISLFKLILCVLISILNIYIGKISTAYVGMFSFIVMYIVIRKFKLSRNVSYLAMIAIFILVVVFRVQDLFSNVIYELFGKTTTLTGRTYIWDASIPYLKQNLFFGHGLINNGVFVPYAGTLWQAHNQILQLIYDVGILGTSLFIIFFSNALNNLKIPYKSKGKTILLAGFCGYIIMMITEICAYFIPFYAFLAVLYLHQEEELYDKV